jgi:hypothetical protein
MKLRLPERFIYRLSHPALWTIGASIGVGIFVSFALAAAAKSSRSPMAPYPSRMVVEMILPLL